MLTVAPSERSACWTAEPSAEPGPASCDLAYLKEHASCDEAVTFFVRSTSASTPSRSTSTEYAAPLRSLCALRADASEIVPVDLSGFPGISFEIFRMIMDSFEFV